MRKWKIHYSGPTDWEIEAEDQFEAEQEAESQMLSNGFHSEEIEEEQC